MFAFQNASTIFTYLPTLPILPKSSVSSLDSSIASKSVAPFLRALLKDPTLVPASPYIEICCIAFIGLREPIFFPKTACKSFWAAILSRETNIDCAPPDACHLQYKSLFLVTSKIPLTKSTPGLKPYFEYTKASNWSRIGFLATNSGVNVDVARFNLVGNDIILVHILTSLLFIVSTTFANSGAT